ncbi:MULTISPECIES: acyltransferase [unclassified Agrococcus]|uniref:acyltransferase family protein n=1 Tax=unclassified Agrococcus TaxID=2615065 RepID=UPI00361854C5
MTTDERATAEARLAKRDLTLDLARVVCVLLVIVVHLLFAGVSVTDDGIALERTLELQPWFPVATWFGLIMPLFFVVGGFASSVGLQSGRRRGDDPEDFARVRLARLARPSLPLFVFLAVVLGIAALLPVDPAFVDGVAVGVGSPLWFLASYMLAQALAPFLLEWHERRPAATLATLVALACATDAVRIAVDEPLAGLPNVAFVWLAVQQLGFWMHDGWFAARRWWQLAAIVVATYGVLAVVVRVGDYSTNMLSNQFPPTVPLLLLGIAQACLLQLLHRPLTALMRLRPAQGVVLLLGSRLMTVYLWHLPLIMVMIGVQLVLPFPLSTPGTAQWWLERIPAFLLVLAVVSLLSIPLVRFERVQALPDAPSAWRTVVALVLFIAPPFAIMTFGLDLLLAALAVAGTVSALLLARIPLAPAPRARLLP